MPPGGEDSTEEAARRGAKQGGEERDNSNRGRYCLTKWPATCPQVLHLQDAMDSVQGTEDDGHTRWQEERAEVAGCVQSRADDAAGDEAHVLARHDDKFLPVNHVLVPTWLL